MARLTFTNAEWTALSADQQRLVTGCTLFNLGQLVQDENGDYFANHPRVEFDDMVRASEAFNVPARDIPNAEDATRRDLFDVVEARLRPRNGQGEIVRDQIAESREAVRQSGDVDAELRRRRPSR